MKPESNQTACALSLSGLNAGSESGLQQHLWLLPELCRAPSHQGSVQIAGLPGHRRGDGGAAQDCQKLGSYLFLPRCDILFYFGFFGML